MRIADRSSAAAESACAECQQHYGPIRFEQIDAGLGNTDHISSSSVEASTPVVDRAAAWR
jgi:hypothetical protein